MAKRKFQPPPEAAISGPLSHQPFAGIKVLFKARPAVTAPPSRPVRQEAPHPEKDKTPVAADGDNGREVFLSAMEDVVPLRRDKERELPRRERPPAVTGTAGGEDREALAQLHRLVTSGEGFILSLTPEYIEGTGFNVHTEYARRLHAGDFSIQGHLDLHGLTVVAAKEVFDAFMHEAVLSGKTGVLIIHGRGLSSPAEPVLKKKVVEWLTTGAWRKRIFAYASARSCDGGTGATYVLFRPRSHRSGRK